MAEDLSRQSHDGFLQNFGLPGAWISSGQALFTCLSCESARDTLIATVDLIPSFELGNDTCVSHSITLDAGANYNSYLWNTGDTTQTIQADSSGFYSVTVDTAGSPCTFIDGLTLTVLREPTGIDSARCGPGEVILEASGSTGSYYWYNSNDSLLAAGNTFNTGFLNETDTFFLAAFDNDSSDQALNFDGTNDYVAINMSYTDPGEITALTVEAWVNTSFENSSGAYSDNWAIVDFDRSEYYNLYVRGDDGRVGFSTTDNTGSIDDFYAPVGTEVNDGIWHHIVAVYDGTDKIIYVDGTQVATSSNPHNGRPLGSGTDRFGFLGDGSEAGSFNNARNNIHYEGSIDEVRIWSLARNLAQLQANKDICLSGTEAGLEAYYKFEDGAGSTNLTDHSNNGRTGTLFNMNTSSAWINTGPGILCSCGESERDTVIASVEIVPSVDLGSDTCVSDSVILDAGTGFSSYTWQDGSSNQTLTATASRIYSVSVDSAGTNCSGSDTINVSVGIATSPQLLDSTRCGNGIVDLIASGTGQLRWYDQDTGGTLLGVGDTLSVGPLSSDSVFYVSAQLGSTAGLDFDGSNDYVAIQNFNYNGSTFGEMTVEAWLRTTDGTNQIIASYDRNEYWRLEINGAGAGTGQVGFDILTNSGQLDFGGSTRVDDGNWHHVAAVYDSGAVRIYVDGNLDASTSRGTRFGSGTTRFGYIGVGSESPTFDGAKGPTAYFNGDIDEFRVWNVARTQAQIQAARDSCLTGSETGLQIYHRMSQGSGSTLSDFAGSNTGDINGAQWIIDAPSFNCSACSESARIPITATINSNIDSINFDISCPGASGTVVYLESFGGSGSYDYSDLSGALTYSGSFDTGRTERVLPNGGNFKVVSQDENECLDTIFNVITTPFPSNSIASSGTNKSCLVPDRNEYYYLTGSSNEIILGVNPLGNDLGLVTAQVNTRPTAQIFSDNAYLGRSYELSAQNAPISNVDVKLYFTTGEFFSLLDSANATPFSEDDLTTIADLGVTKYNGPAEDSIYDPSLATSLNYISQSGSGLEFSSNFVEFSADSFSEFWIHSSESSSPLAVELIEFSAEQKEDQVRLSWTASSSYQSDFMVERLSLETEQFEYIGSVQNNPGNFSFEYHDNEPMTGSNYYRLSQNDAQGNIQFSELVHAYYEPSFNEETRLLVFPNPGSGIFRLKLGAEMDQNLIAEVYNIQGDLVHSETIEPSRNSELIIDLSGKQKGTYLLRLYYGKRFFSSRLILK